MAVQDLWLARDRETKTSRYGRGLRYRVTVPGHPTRAFATKEAATRHEAKLIVEGPPKPSRTVTVGELLDRYIDGKRHLSQGGLGAVKAAAIHARSRWSSTLATEVTRGDVQAWLSVLTVVNARKEAPASQATRTKVLSALRGCFAIALAEGLVASNPTVGVTAGRIERRDAHFLDVPDLESLASAAGERWSAMVWLMGTSGPRIGETCRLNVGDVVSRKVQGIEAWRLRVRKTKSGRPRDAPLMPSVVAMLDLSRDRSEPLFLSPEGNRVDKDHWRRRVFRSAVEKADLPDALRPHDLRHTAASLMIASGATVKDVQVALGHATARMTLDTYGHLLDGGVDSISARMERLVQGVDHTVGVLESHD